MSVKRKTRVFVTVIALVVVLVAVGAGWRLVRGDGTLLPQAGIEADSITPNADGQNDITRIAYKLARNARVSIYFVDARGERHYFRNEEPRGAGEFEVFFSGIVDGYLLPQEEVEGRILKRLLQNGTYTWVIEATDPAGVTERATGDLQIADADEVLPEIRNFTLDKDVFTPNRDGISDRVQAEFFLPKEADVQVFLLLEDGTRLPISERPLDIEPGGPGRHIFDYDGGVDEGAGPPSDGSYPIVAISEDEEGQRIRVEEELTLEYGGVPYAHILSPVSGDTVEYNATSVAICDTLYFTLTVENYGTTPIRTTGPYPGTVYDSEWNYNTVGWPTESGAWRVGIGYENALSDYPYRWGLGDPQDLTLIDGQYYLMPGQRSVVTGGIRVVDTFGVRNPQPMWAGLIHEDVEISLFNNRVDPQGIRVDIPDPEHTPSCGERAVPAPPSRDADDG